MAIREDPSTTSLEARFGASLVKRVVIATYDTRAFRPALRGSTPLRIGRDVEVAEQFHITDKRFS